MKDLLHLQESINNIAEKMPGAKRVNMQCIFVFYDTLKEKFQFHLKL